MRRAARTDGNHAEVIETLRRCGWHVHDTSGLGGGWFDCVAAKGGRIALIEIKDGSKPPSARKLTPAELYVFQAFHIAGAQPVILESSEQAAAL